VPKVALLAVCATALAAMAGCGSSSSSSSSSASATSSSTTASASTPAAAPQSASGTISDAADSSGQLKFTKNALSAKAGKVTIQFTNTSPVPHNFTLQQGTGGTIVGATPTFQGGTKTLTVQLKPGTYTFFCTVPGHRAAGMQGTLVVR
jgi:plastocyanin